MGARPTMLPPLDQARLDEIRRLLAYESSISFTSYRANESMWMLVAEVERLQANGVSDG